MSSDFNFFLNRQGIQGRKGEKGDTGFSPTISVGTDTLDEYKLIIANESNSFETPNLRGNINIQDNGGTYLRYDTETKQISAQSMDAATADTIGGVRLSTEADIVEMGAGSVVTPSDVADALPLYLEGEGAVTITQDELTSKTKIKVDVPSVNDLESRMSTAEAEIADIQTDVANLNNNKVAKTDLATTESAGIVKVDGTSITVAGDGTISASPSGTLPIASTTQLGGVKVDGTSIIADENGVISSVGGGGTGDVTAGGNNTFTGNNEFKKDVTITCTDDLSNPSGLTITNAKNPEGYKTTFNVNSGNGNFHVKTNKAIELMSPFATYIDGGQSSLSVHKDGITFTSNDVLKYYNNDGSYNYVPLVTQENIKAGENITLNKNAETGDITISSTGGGGGTGDVPIATTTTAGKVKPDGTTITVTEDGTISANSSYTLPTASTTQLGGVKVDGTSVTINSDGVISAAGGGSTPTNMVTTDSDQTINGSKTFANGTGTTFTGTSSNSNSLTIDGDDKEIRFNSANQSDAVIKNQGWSSANLNIGTNFNSVKITTTLYDKNGNEITGGGGSAPENMVTTDTMQKITARKEFDTYNYPLIFYGNKTQDVSSSGSSFLQIQGNHIYQREPGTNPIEYVRQHIRAGNGISLSANDESVTISATGGDIPIATTETAGKVKPDGTTITVTEDGTISSVPTTPSNMVTTDTEQTITANKTFSTSSVVTFGAGLAQTSISRDVITIGGTDKELVFSSGSIPNGESSTVQAGRIRSNTGIINIVPDWSNQSSGDGIVLSKDSLLFNNNEVLTKANTEFIAHQAMPSDRYVNLTLGASGTSYTAPADGYAYCNFGAVAVGEQFNLQVISTNKSLLYFQRVTAATNTSLAVMVPVRKDNKFVLLYNVKDTKSYVLKFIYAEGSPSV